MSDIANAMLSAMNGVDQSAVQSATKPLQRMPFLPRNGGEDRAAYEAYLQEVAAMGGQALPYAQWQIAFANQRDPIGGG